MDLWGFVEGDYIELLDIARIALVFKTGPRWKLQSSLKTAFLI